MDKRGIWRVIEATVAVLIVIGALFFMPSQKSENQNKISEKIREVLNEVAKDNTQRNEILSDDNSINNVENKIILNLKTGIEDPRYEYNVAVCDFSAVNCGGASYYPSNKEEIYTEERLISTSLDNSNSKIIKVYAWTK